LHAGLDEKDAMDHVFTLDRIKDNGFAQIGSSNYGWNFKAFPDNLSD
jgi:hypothetical protein